MTARHLLKPATLPAVSAVIDSAKSGPAVAKTIVTSLETIDAETETAIVTVATVATEIARETVTKAETETDASEAKTANETASAAVTDLSLLPTPAPNLGA